MKYRLSHNDDYVIEAIRFFIGKTTPIEGICFCREAKIKYVKNQNIPWPHIHVSKRIGSASDEDYEHHVEMIEDGVWIINDPISEMFSMEDAEFRDFIKDYDEVKNE